MFFQAKIYLIKEYFDLKIYLNQLFAPIRVPFSEKKTTAPIVWMISNW